MILSPPPCEQTQQLKTSVNTSPSWRGSISLSRGSTATSVRCVRLPTVHREPPDALQPRRSHGWNRTAEPWAEQP